MTPGIKPAYLHGALLVAVLVSTFWITWSVSWQQSLGKLQQGNQQYLEQFSGHLDSRLSQFRFQPQLVAKNDLLSNLLAAPERLPNLQAVNRFLEEVNRITGASDTYLMNKSGLTVAASNWRREPTFVGQNFAFRPYFEQAMQGKIGHYFALGTTSKERGYYFSYPVQRGKGILGVLVIKMDLSNIEQYWSNQNTQFVVTDPDGVIFITTRPEWLYRSIKPLAAADLERIRQSQRYPDTGVTSMIYRRRESVSADSHIVDMGLPGAAVASYLVSTQDMPTAGWFVNVLTPLSEMTGESLVLALAAVLAMISVLSVALLIRWRIRRHQERERIYQEAQKELEQKVLARTSELEKEIHLHKSTEETLRKTQNELIQAAKLAMVGEMSASISHELNNPLAAIRSYAENARKLLAQNSSDKIDQNLERIAGLTERMARISTQLKFFSRKSSGRLESANLKPIVETAIEIASPQYREKQIRIDTRGVANGIHADVDMIQLEQVLINLLSNAIHAIGDDDDGEIRIATERADGRVLIHVDDSGAGIDEDDLVKIFEPFFTTRETGVGLGLSISARIVAGMNGKLSALNLAGAGARFTISLPDTNQSHDDA